MNYRIIISAVLALSLTSFAGQAYFIFKKDSTYTAGLLGLDSLNFPKDRRGETDSLFIAGYGLKGFDRVPLTNTEVSFKTDYYDAEKLSVNVQSGPRVGSFLFYLRDVEYIDFIKMNSKSDTDGDGISDVDEIYKIGTNPRMTDTDRDEPVQPPESDGLEPQRGGLAQVGSNHDHDAFCDVDPHHQHRGYQVLHHFRRRSGADHHGREQ